MESSGSDKLFHFFNDIAVKIVGKEWEQSLGRIINHWSSCDVSPKRIEAFTSLTPREKFKAKPKMSLTKAFTTGNEFLTTGTSQSLSESSLSTASLQKSFTDNFWGRLFQQKRRRREKSMNKYALWIRNQIFVDTFLLPQGNLSCSTIELRAFKYEGKTSARAIEIKNTTWANTTISVSNFPIWLFHTNSLLNTISSCEHISLKFLAVNVYIIQKLRKIITNWIICISFYLQNPLLRKRHETMPNNLPCINFHHN